VHPFGLQIARCPDQRRHPVADEYWWLM